VLTIDRFDEHVRLIVDDRTVGSRVTVCRKRRERTNREATGGQHALHNGRVEDPRRRAQGKIDGCPDGRPERETTEHVEGKVRADVNARDRDQHNSRPTHSPRRAG